MRRDKGVMRRDKGVKTKAVMLEVAVAATTRPAHTNFVDVELHCSRSVGLCTSKIDFAKILAVLVRECGKGHA